MLIVLLTPRDKNVFDFFANCAMARERKASKQKRSRTRQGTLKKFRFRSYFSLSPIAIWTDARRKYTGRMKALKSISRSDRALIHRRGWVIRRGAIASSGTIIKLMPMLVKEIFMLSRFRGGTKWPNEPLIDDLVIDYLNLKLQVLLKDSTWYRGRQFLCGFIYKLLKFD